MTRAQARRKLLECVDPAITALLDVVANGGKDQDRVKAAIAILDRTGFGASSTMLLKDERDDLRRLTREELRERALAAAKRLAELPAPAPEPLTIDVTPTDTKKVM